MNMPTTNIIPSDWWRWSDSQPVIIKPLLGGLTNLNYLISVNHELFVLRKNSAISEALNLNRSAEAKALSRADEAGLCAPLIYYDDQHQYMVSRYLGDKTWSVSIDHNLSLLAELLRGIHQLPGIDADLNVENKISCYWQAIDAQAAFTRELKSLDSAVRTHITSAKALNSGLVLCHNDLLASNLIINDKDKLYAIDWEYAAMSDPFYELAVIIEGNALNAKQQQSLLTRYLRRPISTLDWQRLYHWQIIYGYLCVLWYAVQYSNGAMPNIVSEIHRQILAIKALAAKDA
jgi:thiamine kinase